MTTLYCFVFAQDGKIDQSPIRARRLLEQHGFVFSGNNYTEQANWDIPNVAEDIPWYEDPRYHCPWGPYYRGDTYTCLVEMRDHGFGFPREMLICFNDTDAAAVKLSLNEYFDDDPVWHDF